MLATDIKTVRDDPKLKLIKAVSLGYHGLTINLGQRAQGRHAARPRTPACARPSSWRSTARRINQVVFNGEFVPGNQWVSPQNPYYQQAFPIPKRDVAKAKALLKEAGVTAPIALDFMVPNGPENRAVAEVVQSMAAEAGFDLKIRVTEFATSLKQAEDGDYQLYLIGWSGRSDPDGNSYIFQACSAPQNNSAAIATRKSTPAHAEARAKSDLAERKKVYEKIAEQVPRRGLDHLPLPRRRCWSRYTDKLEGYKQMPDGLVRVVGLKLK